MSFYVKQVSEFPFQSKITESRKRLNSDSASFMHCAQVCISANFWYKGRIKDKEGVFKKHIFKNKRAPSTAAHPDAVAGQTAELQGQCQWAYLSYD